MEQFQNGTVSPASLIFKPKIKLPCQNGMDSRSIVLGKSKAHSIHHLRK